MRMSIDIFQLMIANVLEFLDLQEKTQITTQENKTETEIDDNNNNNNNNNMDLDNDSNWSGGDIEIHSPFDNYFQS
eukprot:Pgem_evm1s18693